MSRGTENEATCRTIRKEAEHGHLAASHPVHPMRVLICTIRVVPIDQNAAQIIVNSTGKLTRCIHRIASGCFHSRRIASTLCSEPVIKSAADDAVLSIGNPLFQTYHARK